MHKRIVCINVFFDMVSGHLQQSLLTVKIIVTCSG